MAYDRNYYQDYSVYINGTEIKGVQSFNGGWTVPNTQMSAAGYEFVGTEIEGELVGDLSVSRSIITGIDPVTGMLGSSISGHFIYGAHESRNRSFNFTEGYITSYDSSCSIGGIAESSFSVTAYGDIGTGVTPSTTYEEITPNVATANSMTLNTSFGSTNAIQSYSLSFSLDVSPKYKIGSMFRPSSFDIASPILVTLDFEVLANEYEIKNLLDSICSNDFEEDISFSLNEKCSNTPIASYELSGAKLTSSNISATIGDNLSLSLGFEKRFSTVSELVTNLFK